MLDSVGFYLWGGPGTIRLLKTKYHSPKIDTDSFLTAYDLPYLRKAKSLFRLTDVWVTYSWGFSDETEKEDYEFISSKLAHFRELGLRAHAYIQGLNVVTSEFTTHDIFCCDAWGHLLPYSKGRSFICPNNPGANQLILDRVERACHMNFFGIYIDNLLFGLPPMFVTQEFTPAFGCACRYCQKKFQVEYGYPLPKNGFNSKNLKKFLDFRQKSMTTLMQKIADITIRFNKQLGVNLYDPFLHTPELYFGYSLKSLEPYLSYFFIENHSHPNALQNGNIYLKSFVAQTHKPIFVLSYKNGIGFDPQFSFSDIKSVLREAQNIGYFPCLKASEFTTDGIWHALRLQDKIKEKKNTSRHLRVLQQQKNLPHASSFSKLSGKLLQRYYPVVLRALYEKNLLSFFLLKTGLFQRQLWSMKRFTV